MQPNGFPSPEELIGIYDSRAAIESSDWQDEQDDWEDNDVYAKCKSCVDASVFGIYLCSSFVIGLWPVDVFWR